MSSSPRLSIIIPTYNCCEFIGETLESIFLQSFQDFEIICIDDKSTDNTTALIEKFQLSDPRIILIKNEINRGPSYCRNIGILKAKGEFVSASDSDDIYHKDKFLNQIKFFDTNPYIDICGTFKINFGINEIKTILLTDPEEIKTNLLFSSVLVHPSILMRKQFLINNNLFYNEEYKFVEDYELWHRISLVGNIGNLPQYLTYYRIHKNQLSGKISQMNYYFNRLKKSQLEHLGIKKEPQEISVFSKFCNKKLKTKSELKSILALLDEIIDANLSKQIYSPVLLNRTIKRFMAQNIVRGKSIKLNWVQIILSNETIFGNFMGKITFLLLIIRIYIQEFGKLFHKTEFP